MSARPRSGFTLAEVVVALVILELGLLGALSLVVLAARTLEDARRLEDAVAVASGLADSLRTADEVVAGAGVHGGLPVRWVPGAGGFVVLVLVEDDDTLEVRATTLPDAD